MGYLPSRVGGERGGEAEGSRPTNADRNESVAWQEPASTGAAPAPRGRGHIQPGSSRAALRALLLQDYSRVWLLTSPSGRGSRAAEEEGFDRRGR